MSQENPTPEQIQKNKETRNKLVLGAALLLLVVVIYFQFFSGGGAPMDRGGRSRRSFSNCAFRSLTSA